MKWGDIYCMGGYHKVQRGTERVICEECYQAWSRTYHVYHTIIARRPHLRKLPMDEVFKLLWDRFQELAPSGEQSAGAATSPRKCQDGVTTHRKAKGAMR